MTAQGWILLGAGVFFFVYLPLVLVELSSIKDALGRICDELTKADSKLEEMGYSLHSIEQDAQMIHRMARR